MVSSSNQSQDLPSLTQKQRNFVLNYVSNGQNAYKAAIDAGYSEPVARTDTKKMLAAASIKAHLEKALINTSEAFINKLGLTYEWKALKLKRVIEEYIPDDKEVKLNSSNVKVGLIALAELNKMQGDYAPDKRLSVTVDATKDKLAEVKRKYEDY